MVLLFFSPGSPSTTKCNPSPLSSPFEGEEILKFLLFFEGWRAMLVLDRLHPSSTLAEEFLVEPSPF